jgi:co-chaperonin GroES (HSP10)
MKPLNNNILLELIPIKTSSKIHLTSERHLTMRKGLVLAVGPKCKYLAAGETVYLSKHGGIKEGNKLIIDEGQVFMTVEVSNV